MNHFNFSDNSTDPVIFLPIGDHEQINTIVDILNNNNQNKAIEYISAKLIIPIANLQEILEKKKNIKININRISEEAQAYAFSKFENSFYYTVFILININDIYLLTVPKFNFSNDNNPEQNIQKVFNAISNQKLNNVFKTISPMAIIGKNRDSVLYVAKLDNDNHHCDKMDDLLRLFIKLNQ